jgi:hypothetical protein
MVVIHNFLYGNWDKEYDENLVNLNLNMGEISKVPLYIIL